MVAILLRRICNDINTMNSNVENEGKELNDNNQDQVGDVHHHHDAQSRSPPPPAEPLREDDDARDDFNTKTNSYLSGEDYIVADDDGSSSLDGGLSLGGFSLGSLGEF